MGFIITLAVGMWIGGYWLGESKGYKQGYQDAKRAFKR